MDYDQATNATGDIREVEELADFDAALYRDKTSDLVLAASGDDLWEVVYTWLPSVYDTLAAREGSLFIGPIDHEHPELLLCGDVNAPKGSHAWAGVLNGIYDLWGFSPKVAAYVGDWYTLADATVVKAAMDRSGWDEQFTRFGNVDDSRLHRTS